MSFLLKFHIFPEKHPNPPRKILIHLIVSFLFSVVEKGMLKFLNLTAIRGANISVQGNVFDNAAVFDALIRARFRLLHCASLIAAKSLI